MVEKKIAVPQIEIQYSPNFSVMHVDGTFGGLSDDNSLAWIQFFQDIPNTEVSMTGDMSVTKIRREMLFDVRMSASAFRAIAKFMEDTVKQIDSKKK